MALSHCPGVQQAIWAGIVAVLVACPSGAAAAPKEWRLALDAGPLLLAGGPQTQPGATFGLTAWYGLSEVAWLEGSVQTGFATEPEGGVLDAQLGVVAAFDVLRWVPFGELTVGVSGRTEALVPAPRLGLGIEYLLDPTWSLGAVARGQPLIAQDYAALALSLHLQVAARFGF